MLERIRTAVLILAAFTAGLIACQWPGQTVEAIQDGNSGIADLTERLTSGLRVRTDEEKAFVQQVVSGVESQEIPRELVDSTFLWVRTNKGNSPYPFFYFERVLRLRGSRTGVTIPPFQAPGFSPNR